MSPEFFSIHHAESPSFISAFTEKELLMIVLIGPSVAFTVFPNGIYSMREQPCLYVNNTCFKVILILNPLITRAVVYPDQMSHNF